MVLNACLSCISVSSETADMGFFVQAVRHTSPWFLEKKPMVSRNQDQMDMVQPERVQEQG